MRCENALDRWSPAGPRHPARKRPVTSTRLRAHRAHRARIGAQRSPAGSFASRDGRWGRNGPVARRRDERPHLPRDTILNHSHDPWGPRPCRAPVDMHRDPFLMLPKPFLDGGDPRQCSLVGCESTGRRLVRLEPGVGRTRTGFRGHRGRQRPPKGLAARSSLVRRRRGPRADKDCRRSCGGIARIRTGFGT